MESERRLELRIMEDSEGGSVRAILRRIGWDDVYVRSAAANVRVFADGSPTRGAFAAEMDGEMVGFVFIELHEWNRLAQIQGLAVDPENQRKGVANALVQKAEQFAQAAGARGVYVDTPTDNLSGCAFYVAIGYREAYVMPRYYEDALDGVTFQKFFETSSAAT